jgi:hypothetical protein
MRQGADVGTQYRSAIYTLDPEQKKAAEESKRIYQARPTAAGRGQITTEIADAPTFYIRRGLPSTVPGEAIRMGTAGLGFAGVPYNSTQLYEGQKA